MPADTARNGGGQDGAGAFVGLFGRLIDRLGFLRSCLLLDIERGWRATYVEGWELVCNVLRIRAEQGGIELQLNAFISS